MLKLKPAFRVQLRVLFLQHLNQTNSSTILTATQTWLGITVTISPTRAFFCSFPDPEIHVLLKTLLSGWVLVCGCILLILQYQT